MEQNTSTIIMKGKPVAESMTKGLVAEIEEIASIAGRPPGLAVVLVGEDPASQVYVRIKERMAKKLGILTFDHRIPGDTKQEKLLERVESLNSAPEVDGILVQLPLPSHLSEKDVLGKVALEKDVDVFHPENFGLLALKQGLLRPCTPAGVIEILKHYGVEIEGKSVCLIGRSKTVGLPLSLLLLHENATITVCHSRTADIPFVTCQADIIVAALGRPKFLTGDMVKEGAVVVDVGINRVGENLVGDCDYDALVDKVFAITPVPGGVGPMTVAMLMANTVRAFRHRVLG